MEESICPNMVMFYFILSNVQLFRRNKVGGIRNWQLSEGDGSKIHLLSKELGVADSLEVIFISGGIFFFSLQKS